MIRKPQDQTVEFRCIRGGNGETELHKIMNGEEELFGKGRMFSKMILQPGRSIGTHTHQGDNEIFYILSGTGEYNDNGTIVTVEPGDVALCRDGETHSISNNSDVPLEMIALVLYS
jgi:Mannose-6-phosphate isomerase